MVWVTNLERADPEWVSEMFVFAGVDHERLNQSLIKMGTKCLKTKEMKKMCGNKVKIVKWYED